MPHAAAVILALAFGTLAVRASGQPLEVADAWARATPPGATTAAAYLTIINSGAADRLVGAASPAAREVQLHDHVLQGGMSRMVQLTDVVLSSGSTVRFAPGAKHVMLLDIVTPLVPGAMLELTLEFANAPPLTLAVPVLDARNVPESAGPSHR